MKKIMKLNVNVERLINDITINIRFNCSYNDIKHCDEYPRENFIAFELEMKPLNIFNYLSKDEAEELYNELFVKDDRILSGLKEFAEIHNFSDVAIEHHNQLFGMPEPMLILYKTKEQYVKEVIKEYCYYINCEAKRYDQKTVEIDLRGISKYFIPGDRYAYVFSDYRNLKELKSIAIKNGYDDTIIINSLTIMLYKDNIDINKK